MNNPKHQQLLKLARLADRGMPALLEYILELENKVDEVAPSVKDIIARVKGDKGDKPSREELLALIEPLIPQIRQPLDGQDYTLTEQDKQDIASSIKVPIVKQIVEKTEVIKEQPIITNNTTEKIVENPFTLYGEDIVKKINDLDTYPDNQIDASHIKNLPQQVTKIVGGGTNGIVEIIAGSGITVDNSNLKYPVVSSTGGGSGYQLPTGTVNGVNQTFTFATAPNAIVVDGQVLQKVDQIGNTYWSGTTTVVLTIPPNQSVFAVA